MTRGENFIKKAKCKNNHLSPMINSAWCNLNKDRTILKLHNKGPNNKSPYQKQINFTPRQLQLEGTGLKNALRKKFEGGQRTWNSFFKPTINTLAPVMGMAVGAKSNNPEVGQATDNNFKSISEGKILSLTDLHGNGLRLKVMQIISVKTCLINEYLY